MKYLFWFFIYSFIGWVYESALCTITRGRLQNRGFVAGPFVTVYGFGALAAVLLLAGIRSVLAQFAAAAVLMSAVEYAGALFCEYVLGARLWDYHQRLGNVQGRVCLLGAAAFGVMAVLMLRFVQPAIERVTDMLTPAELYGLTLLLLAVFCVDFVRSLRAWRLSFSPVRVTMEKNGGDEQYDP